jgi:hypothetical protein
MGEPSKALISNQPRRHTRALLLAPHRAAGPATSISRSPEAAPDHGALRQAGRSSQDAGSEGLAIAAPAPPTNEAYRKNAHERAFHQPMIGDDA